MIAARLHVDVADPVWFEKYTTVPIEVDLEEHVFRRGDLGNDVRGVFANFDGRQVLLLRNANEPFSWRRGCPVSIVVPESGDWGDGAPDLGRIQFRYVGKAVVEVLSEASN